MTNPRTPPMLSTLSENWWVLALHGLLAVLFGFAALLLPLDTLEAVGRLFGAYAMLQLSSGNRIHDIRLYASAEKRAIFNDTGVDSLGRIELRGVTTIGRVLA